MGTNYFLHAPACPHCGYEEQPPLHLGKSSAGWCFGLRVRPEEGLEDLADIMALVLHRLEAGWSLRDEYGDDIPVKEWRGVVTDRAWPLAVDHRTQAWFDENHAVPGPAGLVRHRVDGWHCVGHGPGTYDYIAGEFS